MPDRPLRRLVPPLLQVLFLAGSLSACSALLESMEPQYAGSPCAACVASACADAIADCQNDTRCAVYLECLGRCSPASGGDAESACDAGCGALVPAGGVDALAQVRACREEGLGSLCRSCGRAPLADRPLHRLLNQRCSGVSPPAADIDDRTSCPVPPAPDRLNRCATSYCCQSWDTCQNNPDCKALNQCMHDCPAASDHLCNRTCEAKHEQGVVDYNQMVLCTSYYCLPCLPKPIVDSCSICLVSRCLDAWYQCNTNLECINLNRCMTGCTDGPPASVVDCQLACYAAYPDEAQSQQQGLVGCWTSLCALECQPGQ